MIETRTVSLAFQVRPYDTCLPVLMQDDREIVIEIPFEAWIGNERIRIIGSNKKCLFVQRGIAGDALTHNLGTPISGIPTHQRAFRNVLQETINDNSGT